MMARRRWLPIAAALIFLEASASGQGSGVLTPAQASAFMGTWVITMTNPPGAQETVRIVAKDGIVAASVQPGVRQEAGGLARFQIGDCRFKIGFQTADSFVNQS
jgi:hypothetical protein